MFKTLLKDILKFFGFVLIVYFIEEALIGLQILTSYKHALFVFVASSLIVILYLFAIIYQVVNYKDPQIISSDIIYSELVLIGYAVAVIDILTFTAKADYGLTPLLYIIATVLISLFNRRLSWLIPFYNSKELDK